MRTPEHYWVAALLVVGACGITAIWGCIHSVGEEPRGEECVRAVRMLKSGKSTSVTILQKLLGTPTLTRMLPDGNTRAWWYPGIRTPLEIVVVSDATSTVIRYAIYEKKELKAVDEGGQVRLLRGVNAGISHFAMDDIRQVFGAASSVATSKRGLCFSWDWGSDLLLVDTNSVGETVLGLSWSETYDRIDPAKLKESPVHLFP